MGKREGKVKKDSRRGRRGKGKRQDEEKVEGKEGDEEEAKSEKGGTRKGARRQEAAAPIECHAVLHTPLGGDHYLGYGVRGYHRSFSRPRVRIASCASVDASGANLRGARRVPISCRFKRVWDKFPLPHEAGGAFIHAVSKES